MVNGAYTIVIPCYEDKPDGRDGVAGEDKFVMNLFEGADSFEGAKEFVQNEVGEHVPCYIINEFGECIWRRGIQTIKS